MVCSVSSFRLLNSFLLIAQLLSSKSSPAFFCLLGRFLLLVRFLLFKWFLLTIMPLIYFEDKRHRCFVAIYVGCLSAYTINRVFLASEQPLARWCCRRNAIRGKHWLSCLLQGICHYARLLSLCLYAFYLAAP